MELSLMVHKTPMVLDGYLFLFRHCMWVDVTWFEPQPEVISLSSSADMARLMESLGSSDVIPSRHSSLAEAAPGQWPCNATCHNSLPWTILLWQILGYTSEDKKSPREYIFPFQLTRKALFVLTSAVSKKMDCFALTLYYVFFFVDIRVYFLREKLVQQ